MTKSWATGEQHEIRFGQQVACIIELGAAIRSYKDEHGAMLDGTDADEPISAGRGQVLMPWPNRVKDGKFIFNDQSHQLAITEVGKNNASHGLLRWVNWQCASKTDGSVTMTYESHAQSGYAYAFDASIEYSLSENGLRVELSATNAGPTAMPFGMGSHPYFTLGTETVDDTELMCPASSYLIADSQEIPTSKEDVDQSHDYRIKQSLKGREINACWASLARDENGIAGVELTRSGNGLRVWMDSTFDYVMIFTGETVPQPERRRRGVAIEPMTCAPNAYNNGMGLLVLQPGESISGTWGVNRL